MLTVLPTETRAQRRHRAMMSRGAGLSIALIVGNERTAGEARVERWDGAAKAWAALWGLAIASVLVPVAHFVLVPALLLAGPIAAFVRWRQRSGVLGGQGTCPACRAPMSIEGQADEWPFFQICEACRAAVRVEKRELAQEQVPSPAR